MWVERPSETHLSQSRIPGGFSPLARGDETNELETHVTLFPVDDDAEEDEGERDSLAVALKVGIGIAVGVGVGVAGAMAVIKAAPRIKSRLNDLTAKRSGSSEKGDVNSQVTTGDFSNEVDVVLCEHKASMSSAEAQTRLLALLMAAALIADQVRALAHAHIQDADASLELKSSMEKLTAPQITDCIDRMLESNSSLLDEEASAEFMKAFGGGRIVDGQYVPLRNEKVKEALRLTDGKSWPQLLRPRRPRLRP